MADDHTITWLMAPRGRHSLESYLSHLDGTRKAVHGKAMGMGREAAAGLAAHHLKGNAYINVTGAPPRRLDSYVELRDGDPGGRGKAGKNMRDRSAMSIEFGWTTKNGNDVEGLHILGDVMKRAARRYGGK